MSRSIAIIIIIWPSVAFAQHSSAQAEALFRLGLNLMATEKVAEACNAFAESQRLEPAVTTLLNLARCHERLGKLATAWGFFIEVERQTRSATDAANRKLHDVAQDRAQQLEPRLSKLTINVPLKSQFDGLEISRGSDRVDAGLWNCALPMDRGDYTITARAPGTKHWSIQVTVEAENDSKSVEIPNLRNLPGEPGKPSKILPLTLGAGSLALLGGALGFELWTRSTYDAARSEMTSQLRRDALYNSASAGRYAAEVLAVSALATGASAVWLYLRRPNTGAATNASMHVFPTLSGFAVSGQY